LTLVRAGLRPEVEAVTEGRGLLDRRLESELMVELGSTGSLKGEAERSWSMTEERFLTCSATPGPYCAAIWLRASDRIHESRKFIG
jgi:hypothetical protein